MSEEIFSVLKIRAVVVDQLSFVRLGLHTKEQPDEKMGVYTEKEELSDGYRVKLAVKVEREEEFVAEVHMSAFVEIEEEANHKEELLTKNTVAILFPYVRAQMTLITSQPETKPVVLPAMNINQLLEDEK